MNHERNATNSYSGDKFLYQNRLPADDILFPARCVTIAITILLGVAIAAWSRFRFGEAAGILAVALYAFDPNFIAHGRYVTTDVWAAAFTFAACICWCEALLHKSGPWYVLAGVALGLALGSKFSTLFLIPVFMITAVVRRPSWKGSLVTIACAAALAV
jgi:4-amino-4-deoxy-L-arabinose transferase-like glycosyltransferase